jgi:hypothetical protein
VYEAVAAGDSEAVLAKYNPGVEFDFSRSPFATLLDHSIFRGHEGLRRFISERYDAFDVSRTTAESWSRPATR